MGLTDRKVNPSFRYTNLSNLNFGHCSSGKCHLFFSTFGVVGFFKMNDCFIFSRRSLTRTTNQSDGLASSSSWEPITKKRRWHSEHVQISIGISSQFCSKSEAPISINSISFECLISVHWQYGQHIGSGLYIFFTFSPISFSRH